jgi:tight adherence protein B
MGVAIGLVFGIGLFLAMTSGGDIPNRRRVPALTARIDSYVREAGVTTLRTSQLLLLTAGSAAFAMITVLAVSATWSLAVVFGLFGAAAPWMQLRRRIQRSKRAQRELWPYVVDDLASGIRAGLSLPEAVASLADRGPVSLRCAFAGFGAEYRGSGSLNAGLDRLASELADPFADRIVEALRLARDVGGTDVGRLLRTLGQALREDARARGEIEARQSWTVNGARLAVIAPWLVLLLLASRSESVRVYDEPAGLIVLAVGALLSTTAYALMRRIGRLPVERRTLTPEAAS